jgi:hypothetical protein
MVLYYASVRVSLIIVLIDREIFSQDLPTLTDWTMKPLAASEEK